MLFAIDVSLSIDQQEYRLQTIGMGLALQQEDVQRLIGSVPGGVAMSVLQWSGENEQYVALPWALVSTPAQIDSFAERVGSMPRQFVGNTAPGSALEFGVVMHDSNPWSCGRLVIDLSGDGSQNSGRDTGLASGLAVNYGITVNGLAILGSDRRIVQFFKRKIVRGPKSFLETTNGFEDFEEAFHKKLVREIPLELAALSD
ncbi:MAG: DUF1194 domain-containing protein [Paracoccaceae bacterium]